MRDFASVARPGVSAVKPLDHVQLSQNGVSRRPPAPRSDDEEAAHFVQKKILCGWTAAGLGRLSFHASMEATDAYDHLDNRCRDRRPRE